MKNNSIQCALLSLKGERFLLPTKAIAEIVALDVEKSLFNYHCSEIWVAQYIWQDIPLPVVPLNLAPLTHSLWRPKIAILHALFTSIVSAPPYFAVLFDDMPQCLKLTTSELKWMDENNRLAKLTLNSQEQIVTLLDLASWSLKIEELYSSRSNFRLC